MSDQDKAVIEPEDYPKKIILGDVVSTAFKGLQERLLWLFPDSVFQHHLIPASMTKAKWNNLSQSSANIGISLTSWSPSRAENMQYRGNLHFSISIILKQASVDALMFGTGELKGIGTAGILAACAGGLNGFQLKNVGQLFVKSMICPPIEDWFGDRAQFVAVEGYFRDVALSDELRDELHDFDPSNSNIEGLSNG